ncbi:3'-5' exonuclease [Bacterioplanoides sp.]|uniref:3'-5' exonuclease n=1 Tax=Bacterioplanoides sp. TaxID=2066072 RepID=UPI003AFF7AE4
MSKKTKNWADFFVQANANAKDSRLRDYYAQGMVADDCLLSQTPFVALDFETTGLNPEEDDIISIGLVPFTLKRIQLNQSAEWLVKPNQPLEEESVVIHGITHNEVRRAPVLDKILEPLLTALAGRVVVVHHRAIECQFIHHALMQRIQETLEFPVVDTMEVEKQALSHRQGLVGRMLKRPTGSVRLHDCRRRYSLPYYKAHQALTDAIATAELFQAQAAYHFRDDTRIGDVWL